MSGEIVVKTKKRTGNKNRKYGRNRKWCEAYRLRGQREKNRKARWLRHLRLGKFMNRVLALRLQEEYRTEFAINPRSHDVGPYYPSGMNIKRARRR